MNEKTLQYARLMAETSENIVASREQWTGYLSTAARLYKYDYHEQVLIYAQRPDATACASYNLWNNRMGRYLKRGSKGIALVDLSGEEPRLRHVFDVSDTGTWCTSSVRMNLFRQSDFKKRLHRGSAFRLGTPRALIYFKFLRNIFSLRSNHQFLRYFSTNPHLVRQSS